MSVKNQFKLLLGGLAARRSGTAAPAAQSALREFLDRSPLVSAAIFVFTVVAILLISSAGMTTAHVSVLPGQLATVRVSASAPFSYTSKLKTDAAHEQLLHRVPPVYRLDAKPFLDFEAAARELLAKLAAFEATHPAGTTTLLTRPALAAIADTFNARGPYAVTPEDIAALLAAGDAKVRTGIVETGLATLRDLYAQGVTDNALAGASPGSAVIFQIARPTGEIAARPVQSLENAFTLLRVALATDGVSRPAQQALFRLFRQGLVPNVVFDAAATAAREKESARGVKPVTVNVANGQTILEPGQKVSAEQFEMFEAHRKYLLEHSDIELREGLTLFGRVLLVLAMVLASLIYIRIEDPETLRSNVRCGLLALVVIGNLTLIRANYSLGGAEFFLRDSSWASTLPYVAPTALAPLIVAILIDAGSGIFMALFISIFTGVIYGNRLDLLVLTFLASLVAIFMGRDARRRGRVVRAAGAGGLTVAAFAALVAISDQTPVETLVRQMAAGLATGLITGIAVVGLLPILESLFKRTTDITFLELTDYNHPLLRRMQLEAPGTYHHSLVVAQLAENACNAIGAHPLLARVCALFHDIGKINHPSFFGENVLDRTSPHTDRTPLESARIIKAHVTDGVALALQHGLPRQVVDVIQQHHGTTLVRYFYDRAVEQSRAPFAAKKKPSVEPPVAAPLVPMEDFRYDGPRPQFKESAVISLADGVEAASRSLRTATPETLRELIDRIVADRIAERQLDEAPLTFEEISKIKNSFQFTLLNMLHSRVAYPGTEQPPAAAKA
ncbi:MAG: HDIG domain-containing protein [Verrucomicrobia bacterium]|nr:HDIG domain-containing protein [Verrucomicrobiota bacterium]